jgi:hypothetical protein
MVFDVSDAQGYDPVQLARYWDYVRALDAGDGRISYNASFFRTLSPGMLDLLQVGAIVAPGGSAPLPGWTAAATDGPWTLWIAPTAPSIVSIPARRVVVPDRAASLRAVTAPGFDPSADLVLEGAGTSGAQPQGGLVDVARVSVGDQAATFDVHTSGAAEVLVRIPFDSGWRASVDGIEVPVRVADHLMMSVEVPAGTHRVRLAYEDPSIAVGLAGSAVGLAALAVAWWWAEPISARLRRRRRAR